MKRIVLLFVLAACGGGSTDNDGGTDGSGGDVVSNNDASPTDASSNDGSPNDVSLSLDGAPFGDGGLGPGQPCDPKNNLCNPTLLCCSEPNHNPDAGTTTSYVCEQPDNTVQCPKLP